MVWRSFHTDRYARGNIDRKSTIECDLLPPELTVVKSAMVGAIYYAGVKSKGTDVISGIVVRTKVSNNSENNFNYIFYYETDLPEYFDCPKAILDILTATEDKRALRWRNLCNIRLKQKEQHQVNYDRLSVGTILKVRVKGEMVNIEKMMPDSVHKANWWRRLDTNETFYLYNNRKHFEIVQKGVNKIVIKRYN